MKTNDKFVSAFAALSLLVGSQVAFLLVPREAVARFNQLLPLFYLLALTIYLILCGADYRPIPKASRAFLIAACGAVFYFAATLMLGMHFGFGINAAASNFGVILRNLWIYGTTALVTEILRFRIIRGAAAKHRDKAALVITLIYVFLQIDTLRSFLSDINYADFTDFFFTAIFPAVVLNATLCYMAYEGSLLSLFVIRGVYSLIPLTLPYMPNVHKTVWAILTCGLLLVTVIFYHIAMTDSTAQIRRKERVRAGFQKRSKVPYAITLFAIALFAAFALRAFALFPVVVITGSMTGTIDRGSIAFIEKIHAEEVPAVVEEGDIILFQHGNAEIMHRVIEIHHKTDGEPFYVTKGDANPAADPFTVEREQVIGATKAYIPYIGYPIAVLISTFN